MKGWLAGGSLPKPRPQNKINPWRERDAAKRNLPRLTVSRFGCTRGWIAWDGGSRWSRLGLKSRLDVTARSRFSWLLRVGNEAKGP
jgi:hypothetical protein